MRLSERSIMARAADYKAVAFDVFGTLLTRNVNRPTDLFFFMEKSGLAAPGFAAKRVEAERAARAAKKGEITLAEIYAMPQLAGFDPEAECNAELECVAANLPVLRAAQACHARGQRVYAISDMYLPQAQLEKMLRRCGYDFLDKLFVSSAHGVQKRNGKLFLIFMLECGLRQRDVVVFGDDLRADVCGAALAGLRGYWLPPQKARYTPCGADADATAGAVYALARQHTAQLPPAEALGYETIGPLAVAFAQWLHAEKQRQPGAELLLLARDMDLVRRVYGLLYPQEAPVGYLKVSRKSLIPALLQRPMNEATLALFADTLPHQNLQVCEVLHICGFAEDHLPGYAAQEMIDLRSRPTAQRTVEFLRSIAAHSKTPAGSALRAQGALVRAYLDQEQIAQGKKIFVDIGSGGTTQRLLEELCGTTLQGCYLACDERLARCLPAERTNVFLFAGAPAPAHYWAGQPMLEKLLSEPCGATLGYRQEKDAVVPVTAQEPPDPVQTMVQAGALRFARDWQQAVYHAMPIAAQTAIAPYLNLVSKPKLVDARLLGATTVEDGGVYPLAAAKSTGYYLLHPRAVAQDLALSRWKVAFLKQLLRLPLPYGRLYAALWEKKRNKK